MNETKQKIMDTYVSLSRTNPLDKISIKLIIETAGLNRSTFYYYFEDIDELVDELEVVLLAEINEVQKMLYSTLIFGVKEYKMKAVEDFLEKNEDLLSIFVLKNRNIAFIDKVIEQSKKNNLFLRALSIKKMTKKQDYAIRYIVNAQLWLIAYWIENKKDLPLAELMELSREMLTKGPVNQIVNLEYLFKRK